MNPQTRDRAIPVPQTRFVGVETVEAPALQRVAFDVPAAALLLAVFLRVARLRRQGCEAPVGGEGEIDIMAVGIEETRAHDGRFRLSWRMTSGTPPRSRNDNRPFFEPRSPTVVAGQRTHEICSKPALMLFCPASLPH